MAGPAGCGAARLCVSVVAPTGDPVPERRYGVLSHAEACGPSLPPVLCSSVRKDSGCKDNAAPSMASRRTLSQRARLRRMRTSIVPTAKRAPALPFHRSSAITHTRDAQTEQPSVHRPSHPLPALHCCLRSFPIEPRSPSTLLRRIHGPGPGPGSPPRSVCRPAAAPLFCCDRNALSLVSKHSPEVSLRAYILLSLLH